LTSILTSQHFLLNLSFLKTVAYIHILYLYSLWYQILIDALIRYNGHRWQTNLWLLLYIYFFCMYYRIIEISFFRSFLFLFILSFSLFLPLWWLYFKSRFNIEVMLLKYIKLAHKKGKRYIAITTNLFVPLFYANPVIFLVASYDQVQRKISRGLFYSLANKIILALPLEELIHWVLLERQIDVCKRRKSITIIK